MNNNFVPFRKSKRSRFWGTPFLLVVTVAMLAVNGFALPTRVEAANSNLNVENILAAHNEQRKKKGLAPLKLSEILTTSAQRKAQLMLAADCWSHYCPNGKSPWEFFDEAGYNYLLAGENLAEGFYNLDNLMQAWLNSPTHRDNIMRADYEDVGFGIVQGDFQGRRNNVVIAAHFGTPKPDPLAGFTVPSSGDLPTPAIIKPKENAFLNSSRVKVSGIAPDASQVEILLDNQSWAVVDANKGVFFHSADLAQGEYIINARSRVGTRMSVISKPSKFTVDTQQNQIDYNDIIVVNNNLGRLKINVVSPDLVNLSFDLGEETYSFSNVEGDVWTAQIHKKEFDSVDKFEINTEDKAGNKWKGSLKPDLITQAADKLNIPSGNLEDGRPGRVISANIKTQINIGALFLFAALFGMDYLALQRTGLTKQSDRSRTQLHMGLMMILMIVAFAGSLSGEILEGVNIFN